MSAAAPPTTPACGAAATRVFGVPELVSLIIHDFSRPSLARIATISKATASQAHRLLYRSLSVVYSGRVDPGREGSRLSALVGSLEGRPGLIKSFTLELSKDVPTRPLLRALVKNLAGVTELKLKGLNPRAIESFNIVLPPIAAQLTNLTLDYSGWSTPTGTHHLLGLLSACTGLRHLDLVDLTLAGNLFRFGPAPSYQLTTLGLSSSSFHFGSITGNHLEYLIGNSVTTLESVPLDVDSLDDSAWTAIDRHALPLELRIYDPRGWWVPDIDRVIVRAQQPSVRNLALVLRGDHWEFDADEWAHITGRVAEAMDRLDEKDRAKVTLDMIELEFSDAEGSDPEESEADDEEDEDESEQEEGLQDIRQFFIRSTS